MDFNRSSETDIPERATQAFTTFDQMAFTCEDAAEMEARLTQRGIEYRVSFVTLTGIKQVFLRNPADNGVELNFLAEATYQP